MSKMPHDTEQSYGNITLQPSEHRLSERDSGGGGEPTASTSNMEETGNVTTNEKMRGLTNSDSKEEGAKENAEQGPVEVDKPVEEASQSTSTESVGKNAQTETAVSDEGRKTSESQSNLEGANDSARFHARQRRGLRQYRRWSGADESSGDEQASPSRERSSTSPMSLFDHLADMSSSSSDSSNSSHSLDQVKLRTAEDAPTPKALLKPKPSHKWFAVKELIAREAGYSGRWQGAERFQHRYYGSLHAVQRLELMYKLQKHRGCVNSLNFNRTGELLITASDDRKIILWDWAADRSILSYDSAHTSNVFQAKFLPLSGDRHIVTCARDGQVRLGVLSGTGVCKGTRILARHHGSTHKLATQPQTPHEVLSAGEDAVILSIDVRQSKPNKLLLVKEAQKKVGIYSIHSNPVNSNEFLITGEDQYVRLYDKRKMSSELTRFCPKHLLKPPTFLHITCGVFNYNGTEVIASYNDDDIYLFDTRLPLEADYIHKYEGHRNSITVKGVNFFGPRSEYIVSGSDCGNIFFWDKSTEAIVQWMRGDEEGVVNCLEPHPQVPILATSGLDNDIKIWVPSCEEEPKMAGLKASVITNQGDREQTRGRRSDPFDNQQMRWLWRQIQRFEQQRGASGTGSDLTAEPRPRSPTMDSERFTTELPSSSSDDDTTSHRPQCSPS